MLLAAAALYTHLVLCFACNTSVTMESGDSEAKKNMIFLVSFFRVADQFQVMDDFVIQ